MDHFVLPIQVVYYNVINLPYGGSVTTKLEPGRYEMRWYNPRSGSIRRLALHKVQTGLHLLHLMGKTG